MLKVREFEWKEVEEIVDNEKVIKALRDENAELLVCLKKNLEELSRKLREKFPNEL